MVIKKPSDPEPAEEVRAPRHRSRHAGLLADYATKKGTRWKYQLYVPIDPARPELGEKRATRGGFETMKQAQAALDKALKARTQHAKFVADMPTIAEYADLWVNGLRLEASTIHGYRKIIRNQVTPQLGTVPLDKITATRLAAHYRELERCGRADGKGLSPNSVHKVHVLIGAMLSTAIEEGLIAVNPAKLRRTVNAPTSSEVRAAKPEIRVWTGQQLAAFLAWDRDTIQDEFHPLWHTLAYTGSRRGEALALTWADLSPDTGRLSIRRAADAVRNHEVKPTKTGNSRVVDLDPETLRVLKAHKATRGAISLALARPEAFVFGDDEGRVRVPDSVTSTWTRRIDRACRAISDLPRITLKGLRHTHATLLLELQEHPKVVQERLGHSTITTTMNIYSHVAPTMQKQAASRFAALVASGSSAASEAESGIERPA